MKIFALLVILWIVFTLGYVLGSIGESYSRQGKLIGMDTLNKLWGKLKERYE